MSALVLPGEGLPTGLDLGPVVLPPSWRRTPAGDRDVPGAGKAYSWRRRDGVTVLMGVEDRSPGGVWWHLSIAHPKQLPSWQTVVEAKEVFMGRETCAMHLVPPRSHWLNVHPNCLHLWVRLDADTYPRELYD